MRLFVFALACCVFYICTSGTACAQPQEAYTACEGKVADDECSVGPGKGICLDHGRGLFCMPEHMQDGRMQNESMGQPPSGGGPGGGKGGMRAGRPPKGQGGSGPLKGVMAGQQQQQRGASYPAPGTMAAYEKTDPTRTGGAFDTAQTFCFDETKVMACPKPGQAFYGQDAHYLGTPLSFADNRDGTITDNNTGLTWEKAHHANRLPQYQAADYCEGLTLGGYHDWRLPNIKELYSIVTFDGAAGVKAYLDTEYFDIEPPDSLDANDRFAATHRPEMMGQTTSSTIYTGNLWGRGQESAFFMNFLDGRIKCAPTHGRMGQFYRCVRGPEYGRNEFADNGDGTATDGSSGLMWQQTDDGTVRDWPGALAYCEGLSLAGHDDWRLPNAKELQYIMDYSRIPATPEALRQSDPKAWFWTSTTLGDHTAQAVYLCFGKGVSESGVDVHGAGAQRSDPKTVRQMHGSQQGGQEDEIRVMNLVRCVRN